MAAVVWAGVGFVQAVLLRNARIVWAKLAFCCVTVIVLVPRLLRTSVLKFS